MVVTIFCGFVCRIELRFCLYVVFFVLARRHGRPGAISAPSALQPSRAASRPSVTPPRAGRGLHRLRLRPFNGRSPAPFLRYRLQPFPGLRRRLFRRGYGLLSPWLRQDDKRQRDGATRSSAENGAPLRGIFRLRLCSVA